MNECQNCRYFKPLASEPGYGRCSKWAPDLGVAPKVEGPGGACSKWTAALRLAGGTATLTRQSPTERAIGAPGAT
jgi:hypothetical protein